MAKKRKREGVSQSSSEYFTSADHGEGKEVKKQEEHEVKDDLDLLKLKVNVESAQPAGTKTLLEELEQNVLTAKEKTSAEKMVKKAAQQEEKQDALADEGEIQQEAG